MKRLVLPGIAFVLSACGSKGPLEWPDGSPPPAPVGEARAPTPSEMLEPPPQAVPERLNDPVENADQRREDYFDLPPPG